MVIVDGHCVGSYRHSPWIQLQSLALVSTEYGRGALLSFFFFQAEDGIRDLTVTGVQTCALPIFRRPRAHATRPAAWPRGRSRPESREASGVRARAPGAHAGARPRGHRRRRRDGGGARRRGRVRSAPSARLPRRAAARLREPALLPAPALAGRRPRRAVHPRRRHGDRRVSHGHRGGSGHRRDLRVGVDPDRAARDRGRATRAPHRAWHAPPARAPAARARDPAGPAGGRADVCREAHGGRVPHRRVATGCGRGAGRPRRQPATGRVDGGRREARQGLARPTRAGGGPTGSCAPARRAGDRRRHSPARRGAARRQAPHDGAGVVGGAARARRPGGGGRRLVSSRETAFAALLRVEDGAYSNVVLPAMLRDSALDPRDRAFATELVYGTLRQQRALDYLLGLSADRPLQQLDTPTRVALRLGAYQLTRSVPAHAAVRETVAIAPRKARGYVNAVLRAVAGVGPNWPWPGGESVAALAVRLSYPDWIVEALVAQFGLADARASLGVANEPPPVALRVNPERASVQAVADELRAAGADVTSGTLEDGALLARGIGDPARLPAVAEGRATPQDEASQAVVAILDPQPGDTIVDAAAAPGGKSTAIAERVGTHGRVVACDVHPGRTRLVASARDRLQLDRVLPVV